MANFFARLERHPRAIEASLFALGLLVMGLVLAFAPSSFRPAPSYNDYLSYYQPPAAHLLAGKGYTALNGSFALHDPPGYPLVLAFVYWIADGLGVGREGAVNVLTVVTLAVACVLVYRLGRAMFGLRVGIVAAVVWVTYPIEMAIAPYRFAEVPFTPVLYLTALIFVDGTRKGLPSWRRMTVVGALIGVDALIRPQAILLVVPYALALWVRARQLRAPDKDSTSTLAPHRRWAVGGLCVVLFVSYLAAVAPWEVWAEVATHQTVTLSNAGPSGILDGLTVGLRAKDERGHASLPSSVIAVEKRVSADRSSLTSVGKIVQFMDGQFRAHPLAVAELVAIKAASSFYGTNSLTHQLLIALVQLPYLALMIAGLVLAWRAGGWQRSLSVFAVLVVGYMWLMTISVLSIVRYMTPALGLLVPFAALALVRGWDLLRQRGAAHTSGGAEPRSHRGATPSELIPSRAQGGAGARPANQEGAQ
jgi:hypothetical protein